MELETMTIEDLAALRDRAIAVLADKVGARQRELQAEMERVGGFVSPGTKKRSTEPPVPSKPVYRHPTKPELVWSGRGTQAKWVTDYLAGGGKIEELKVA
jgi:DNA-binding protein H-NS